MRRTVVFVLVAAACTKGEKRISVTDSAIKTPESVLYDAASDVYLVSNINGSPLEKDNNGFISRVRPDGHMEQAQWIAAGMNGVTLHAPKGMAAKGDTLFVADIDVVRVFDRTTGVPLGDRTVPGASFLNDMCVGPDGSVYVTDTGIKAGPPPGGFAEAGTDALYRFGPDGRAVAVVQGKALGRPNGITADATGVIVVTFGSGEVYRIDPKTGRRTDLPKPPKGQLDGVERLADGSLLISSWEGEAVYRLSGGAYTTAVDSVPSPADIGYDGKRAVVVIPIFMQNRIEVREVK